MGTISSLGIGSGLDLNGLLDQLKDAEREKLAPIERQIKTEDTKITAFGQLKGALSKLQDAAETLNSGDLYSSLSASTSGDSVGAAADKNAMPGSYRINVDTLATRGTLASGNSTDDLAKVVVSEAQNMTFTFGADGAADPLASTTVAIAADSTLEDVRDAINADEEAGVNASVINDGTGYRLALSSRETGADASVEGFTFDGSVAPTISVDSGAKVSGEDASLTVNGIGITSANNQVEDAIQGVTLNLKEEGESTVTVEQDTLAVREAVNGFVDAYNDLKETTGKLTSFNEETGQAGQLNGDSTVRMVESRLRDVVGGMGNSAGDFSMLSDIGIALEKDGIALEKDGTLSVDSDKLDEVISNDQQALADFFSGVDGSDGFAARLEGSVNQMLSDNGAVEGAISGAKSRFDSLGQRYESMEQSVDRTIARYRSQFSQLDGMIAQMNQTSSYLTQQFDALNQIGKN